eukprot:Hpha_TRINITY_DN15415_c1_g2::TRINITY_DN15415_c1_g2_i1::g.175470::m.175470
MLAMALLLTLAQSGHVANLIPGDWEKWGKVLSRPPYVVNFYAHHEFRLDLGEGGKPSASPVCSICPSFARVFENLAVAAAVHNISSGQLSCSDHKVFCEKMKIHRYPEVVLYTDGGVESERYEDKLALVELMLWAQNATGKPVTQALPRLTLYKHWAWEVVALLIRTAEALVGKNQFAVGAVLVVALLPPTALVVSVLLYCCCSCMLCALKRTLPPHRRQSLREKDD